MRSPRSVTKRNHFGGGRAPNGTAVADAEAMTIRRVVLLAIAAVAPLTMSRRASAEEAPAFDRQAASAALTSVDLARCRSTNAHRGEGHVRVTFAPTGSAKLAVVDRGPMVGTPEAKCLVRQFMKAKVPAFTGGPVVVGKSFVFG